MTTTKSNTNNYRLFESEVCSIKDKTKLEKHFKSFFRDELDNCRFRIITRKTGVFEIRTSSRDFSNFLGKIFNFVNKPKKTTPKCEHKIGGITHTHCFDDHYGCFRCMCSKKHLKHISVIKEINSNSYFFIGSTCIFHCIKNINCYKCNENVISNKSMKEGDYRCFICKTSETKALKIVKKISKNILNFEGDYHGLTFNRAFKIDRDVCKFQKDRIPYHNRFDYIYQNEKKEHKSIIQYITFCKLLEKYEQLILLINN